MKDEDFPFGTPAGAMVARKAAIGGIITGVGFTIFIIAFSIYGRDSDLLSSQKDQMIICAVIAVISLIASFSFFSIMFVLLLGNWISTKLLSRLDNIEKEIRQKKIQ